MFTDVVTQYAHLRCGYEVVVCVRGHRWLLVLE